MLRIQDTLLEDVLHYCSRENDCVFLDTSLPSEENSQSLLFVEPVNRLVCREGDDLETYLEKVQEVLDSGLYLAGWLGYEFGSILEGRYGGDTSSFSKPPAILADLGVFLKPYKFDHHTGENTFFSLIEEKFPPSPESFSVRNLQPNMSQDEFVEALLRVKEFIAAGDTYQVNYTMKLFFDFQGSVEALYGALRRNQSVGYGAFIKSRGEHILSFSPELFFKKSPEDITVRPMKGTAERGNHLREEQYFTDTLHYDPKNRAENVMIVDLLRNDLSRLLFDEANARVTTTSLFDVESYESLLQMTSTVKGECGQSKLKDLPLSRLFHSLFPCGSITGAPKIRTMQIIEELEKEPRGVYTGAIGYIAPDGNATFNVPIRTIRLQGQRGEMGIGAGITHGSDPVDEWYESLLKGRFLTHLQQPFELFETILWQKDSGYYLLDQHLSRMQRGSSYFKFSFDIENAKSHLQQQTEQFVESPMRVRLVLKKDGELSVTASPCDAPVYTTLPLVRDFSSRPLAGVVRFAKTEIREKSPYLFYKTSRRLDYDAEYTHVVERGEFDAIFLNDKGELTEGCISNIILLRDDVFLTPSVECGLLPGVMRDALLTEKSGSPTVIERVLFRQDVESADAVFLCNSVRGVVRVRLVD